MDRAGPRSRSLIATVTLVGAALLIAAAARAPVLRAERWLAPADSLVALSTRPRECLAPAVNREGAMLVAIGHTAFRTPELLGGQAAKLRMTCASCHTNGRNNPYFAFPDLSGDPGTADITSSLMSSHQGNGIFDPRPIPDLAVAANVSRDPADPALASAVHNIVTREFDGVEPGDVLDRGLLAYIRALHPCASDSREPLTVDAALNDVASAVGAAGAALKLGDKAAARLMLSGARAALGDIDERYPGQALARAALRRADVDLLQQQLALDAGDATTRVVSWHPPATLVATLRRGAARSLYDRRTLAHALKRA